MNKVIFTDKTEYLQSNVTLTEISVEQYGIKKIFFEKKLQRNYIFDFRFRR